MTAAPISPATPIPARWRNLRKRDVIAPIAGGGGARTTLRLLAHVLGVYRVSLASLLDPTPLRSSLDRWTDWRMVARNVERGVIDSVCVVATSLESGGPVGFVSSRESAPGLSDDGLRHV